MPNVLQTEMWTPYQIGIAPRIRSIHTREGLGDHLRMIAFAERQAFHAFKNAIEVYADAPVGLRDAWKWVAEEEAKHETWLLKRLTDIGEDVSAVPVDLHLFDSLIKLATAREFALFISDAEERGRKGAEKIARTLLVIDPVTAKIFNQIALEEREHIALVDKFFTFAS